MFGSRSLYINHSLILYDRLILVLGVGVAPLVVQVWATGSLQ
jgi:hypothetical protein